MTDHHKRCGLLTQVSLQPLNGFDIQVVGGFVEEEQIGFLEKNLAQGDAHLPATGVIPHLSLGSLGAEADGWQQFVDTGIELVAVQCFEPALKLAELLDEFIQMIWIFGSLLRAHGLLHLLLAVQHGCRFTKGLEQLLPNGAIRIDVEFLLQKGDPRFSLSHHLTAAGFFVPGNQPHLG